MIAANRLHGLVGDHVEGDKRADGKVVVDDRIGAEEQEQRGRELAHILDRLLAAGAHELRLEAGGNISGEALLPLRLHERLDRGGFHSLHADDSLTPGTAGSRHRD